MARRPQVLSRRALNRALLITGEGVRLLAFLALPEKHSVRLGGAAKPRR